MAIGWDILLDGGSIKDQITGFQVRDSDGGYAMELTLDAADPDFYDQFTYTALPTLRLEVKVNDGSGWVSLGNFYIERPGGSADPDGITWDGIWGRSESAKAGAPWAPKVTRAWTTSTTACAIVSEMAALADVTVNFEMPDYTVFAGSYSVDGVYPIDVISELAAYAGGVVGCNAAGEIVVRPNVFHLSAADNTVTDDDIAAMTETLEYPEFGNRIKIGADGSDAGISVTVDAPDGADCLSADGVSKSKLYAFVSDSNGPVNDGVVVTWTTGEGLTLAAETTTTGQMLMANRVHQADNYYNVTVDYPVASVIGVWAYSDRQHTNNLWRDNNGSYTFEDNVITVGRAFSYCDQTLVVAYITSGCTVNTVTAGTVPMDVTVTADVNGSRGEVDVKLGNVCSCGSSLDAVKNTDTDICFGNSAPVLIWAEIGGGPASGMIASLTLTGCGALSSTKKILGSVRVSNETNYVINEIIGTSQVEVSIHPDDDYTPAVYLATDTSKSNDLYLSHDGKVVDLSAIVDTGTEVLVDYTADGAAVVAWLSDDVEDDCDAEILIKIADGTEGGLSETVSLSATDCSDLDGGGSSDPTTSEYSSDSDPEDFDNDGQDGGEPGEETGGEGGGESGGVKLDACDVIILNRVSNIYNATPDTYDSVRFGTGASTDCTAEDPYGCPCSEMCESEIRSKGSTYDYNQTIHETVVETYAEGTPEYNEAYAVLRGEQLSECESACESARSAFCAGCEVVSAPLVLSPGETGEVICDDGTVEIITMPEDGCGMEGFSVGCCNFEVKSTAGQWTAVDVYGLPADWGSSNCLVRSFTQYKCSYDFYSPNGAYRYVGQNLTFYEAVDGGCPGPGYRPAREGSCVPTNTPEFYYPYDEITYEWTCE